VKLGKQVTVIVSYIELDDIRSVKRHDLEHIPVALSQFEFLPFSAVQGSLDWNYDSFLFAGHGGQQQCDKQ
jgi:hypothetical protein